MGLEPGDCRYSCRDVCPDDPAAERLFPEKCIQRTADQDRLRREWRRFGSNQRYRHGAQGRAGSDWSLVLVVVVELATDADLLCTDSSGGLGDANIFRALAQSQPGGTGQYGEHGSGTAGDGTL